MFLQHSLLFLLLFVLYFYCYFYCIFNKHSTRLIFATLLYFAYHFFKFWRIILSSVINICNIKFLLKMSLIYPCFTTIFYNFNTIFFHAFAVNRVNVIILHIHTQKIFFDGVKCLKIFDCFYNIFNQLCKLSIQPFPFFKTLNLH